MGLEVGSMGVAILSERGPLPEILNCNDGSLEVNVNFHLNDTEVWFSLANVIVFILSKCKLL